MPLIRIECRNFPPALNIHIQNEDFSWDDIVRAAITVGRANWLHVFQHGIHSYWEIACRCAMIRMTLFTEHNHFCCSDAFRALDPSEKGAVSYFVGMIMCKLFAERFLHTPWLMHIDKYRSQLGIKLLSGRSRPDLIGHSLNGEWVVFESKGRSSKPSQDDKTKAKKQATRILAVSGQPITTGVALFSYYRNKRLQIYCEDPPAERERGIQLKIDMNDFIKDYYLPLMQLIGPSELRRQSETGEPTRIESDDFSIGIEKELARFLFKEDYIGAYKYLVRNKEMRSEDNRRYATDGIYVKAGESWHKLINKERF